MCGRRSSGFSVGSGMRSRVLLVSLLLLCVALSSLAAWPTKQASVAEEPAQILSEVLPQPEVATAVQVPAQPIITPLTPSTDFKPNAEAALIQLLRDYQNQQASSKKISQDMNDQLAEIVGKLESYFALEEIEDALAAENAAKLDAITGYAQESNSKLEKVEKLLAKEKSSKPFVSAGMALGFHEGVPVYGVSGQAGVRFGGSFTASLGGSYMFGSFKTPVWEKDLDRILVTGLIGWEF